MADRFELCTRVHVLTYGHHREVASMADAFKMSLRKDKLTFELLSRNNKLSWRHDISAGLKFQLSEIRLFSGLKIQPAVYLVRA
jgi:hypothetical protein